MSGYNERAHADKHDQCGQENASLVGSKEPTAISILVLTPLCHKDGVVIALAENKRGEDHVNDVEVDVQQPHDTKNPDPAHRHWQERQSRQLNVAHGKPQEEKHNETAGPPYIIEGIVEIDCHDTVELTYLEAVMLKVVEVAQLLLKIPHTVFRDLELCDEMASSLAVSHHVIAQHAARSFP